MNEESQLGTQPQPVPVPVPVSLTQPQPQPHSQPTKLQEPFPQKPSRNRTWIGIVLLVLIIVVTLIGAYAVTLGPEHYAQAQAVRVDGTKPISIGDPSLGSVVPAAEWSERPMVTPLIGELQFFKNPEVIFGATPGVQLESPDGMLTVTLEPLGGTPPAAIFADVGLPGSPIQEELLATGLTLTHVSTGESAGEAVDGLVAVIGLDAEFDTQSSVLVRVTLSDDATLNFTNYLPALSALFETVALHG